MAKKGLGASLGYNPYRDSEGKFDDGPSLLASRGRPKVSASDQRKKIDEAKAKLRAKYAIEEKPDREKSLTVQNTWRLQVLLSTSRTYLITTSELFYGGIKNYSLARLTDNTTKPRRLARVISS